MAPSSAPPNPTPPRPHVQNPLAGTTINTDASKLGLSPDILHGAPLNSNDIGTALAFAGTTPTAVAVPEHSSSPSTNFVRRAVERTAEKFSASSPTKLQRGDSLTTGGSPNNSKTNVSSGSSRLSSALRKSNHLKATGPSSSSSSSENEDGQHQRKKRTPTSSSSANTNRAFLKCGRFRFRTTELTII